VSDSPIDSLSTAFSGIPSVVPTEDLYPVLQRSIDLGNAMVVKIFFNKLIETIPFDINSLEYRVIRTFI
jgi:hypothetical protein